MVEKASSLIEAEESLESRASSSPPSADESSSLDRRFKPIESGVFTGIGRREARGERGGGASPGAQVSAQVAQSLQNALTSASRGEAELGALHRSIRDASRALTASRHAHEALTEELRTMHRGLSEVLSEKAAIERYAALLTQERDAALDAAEEARREAKRDREFLLREQDRFIQLLLEEHEAELQQLRRALGQRSKSAAGVSAHAAGVSAHAAGVSAHAAGVSAAEPPAAAPRDSSSEPPVNSDEGTTSPPPVARTVDARVIARVELAASGERPRAIPLPDVAERGPLQFPAVAGGEPLSFSAVAGGEPLSFSAVAGGEPLSSDTRSSEIALQDAAGEERHSTYPPPPTVLDLDALAHEVDGNSERPPPIRRVGASEPKLHLRPARVPTQLLDTLIERRGDEPSGES